MIQHNVIEQILTDQINGQFNDSTMHKYISAEPILLQTGKHESKK